ncbi:DnaJ domain-containing protein [bacterium]|nr:DnaJ domain-containing protein [bacterium]
MAAVFPGLNFFSLIPQLRLLDGFIYLPSRNGVCFLSTDTKTALADLLGINHFGFDDSATSESANETRTSAHHRWFAALGLDAYASPVEVKKMYRVLARKYHPDRHRNENVAAQVAAEERMKEINEAYREICRSFAA